MYLLLKIIIKHLNTLKKKKRTKWAQLQQALLIPYPTATSYLLTEFYDHPSSQVFQRKKPPLPSGSLGMYKWPNCGQSYKTAIHGGGGSSEKVAILCKCNISRYNSVFSPVTSATCGRYHGIMRIQPKMTDHSGVSENLNLWFGINLLS